MKLEVKNLSAGYGSRRVLNDISFSVESGETVCLLGPNGVGKTTLFQTILGSLHAMSGTISIDGKELRTWSEKQMAQAIAYVPQAHTPPFAFSALDVVVMGRNAHINAFSTPSKEDIEIGRACMERMGVLHLADRDYTAMSGGERQMVLIARALTQGSNFIMMDEPAANLDFGNQAILLNQVNVLRESGLGVIMSTHAPDQAFICATKVALLTHQNFYIGTPEEILVPEKLQEAYGIPIGLLEGECQGRRVRSCIALPQAAKKET